MRTAFFPYGFNSQVADNYSKDKPELIGVNFWSLSRTHSRNNGMKYNYATKLSGKEFLIIFNKATAEFLPASILSLSKQSLKGIITIFNDEIKRLPSRFKCMKGT